MSEQVEWVLNEFGLSEKEVKVYLYLSKSGSQKAIEISRNLKIHKVEVYRFLKSLENKGLVESTLERPTRFAALPLEQILDSLISKRKKITTALQKEKEKILNQWKAMNIEVEPVSTERFVVLSGRENIYLRILNLIQHTQKEIIGITTNLGLLFAGKDGILSQGVKEAVERSRIFQVSTRLITQITSENLEFAQEFLQKFERHSVPAEIRHLSLDAKFAPRLVIRDDDEAIMFLTPKNLSTAVRYETALWTNSKTVVSALQALFEEMWRNSQPLSRRMKQPEKQG